jgi:beta-phosphoglucomutase-like phosphatase (HAD superfamily)
MIADHFKLVIFDCDGVLVDSEPIINQAHAHVLTACGYPITEQNLVDRFCGMSDREMLQIIEREWGRALPTSYAEHVGSMIEAGFRQSLAPIEGVTEAIDSLTLPICVASSSSLEQIRQKLKITGPWDVLANTCSARRWSHAASRLPTCFYMPHSTLRRRRTAVSSSRIAPQVLMPPSLPA